MGPKAERENPDRKQRSGFFAPTRKNGPTSSADGIGIALTGRGCPVPPQGRGGGSAKSSCVNGFAGGPAVARCSGSAAIATGATDTAASDAGEKPGGNNGGTPTGGTSKGPEGRLDHRDRQRDYRERRRRRVTDHPSADTSASDSIVETEPSPSENGSESGSGEARYAGSAEFEPACIICGRTLGAEPVKRPSFPDGR